MGDQGRRLRRRADSGRAASQSAFGASRIVNALSSSKILCRGALSLASQRSRQCTRHRTSHTGSTWCVRASLAASSALVAAPTGCGAQHARALLRRRMLWAWSRARGTSGGCLWKGWRSRLHSQPLSQVGSSPRNSSKFKLPGLNSASAAPARLLTTAFAPGRCARLQSLWHLRLGPWRWWMGLHPGSKLWPTLPKMPCPPVPRRRPAPSRAVRRTLTPRHSATLGPCPGGLSRPSATRLQLLTRRAQCAAAARRSPGERPSAGEVQRYFDPVTNDGVDFKVLSGPPAYCFQILARPASPLVGAYARGPARPDRCMYMICQPNSTLR